MKVIDTTVAIDHLRGLEAATTLLSGLMSAGHDIYASELVRFELLAGARQRELSALEGFMSAIAWVPVNEDIARLAGRLARRFGLSHTGIDAADYLIGATALLLRAELLTTNVRHFPMLERLRPAY
jgi:predicted nucleic acid-binding protein